MNGEAHELNNSAIKNVASEKWQLCILSTMLEIYCVALGFNLFFQRASIQFTESHTRPCNLTLTRCKFMSVEIIRITLP